MQDKRGKLNRNCCRQDLCVCVCVFPPAEFDVCLIQDYFSSLIFFFFSFFFLIKIRKLRRELESAQEKVVTLTTQLSTNVSPRMLLSLHVSLIYVNVFTVEICSGREFHAIFCSLYLLLWFEPDKN